MLGRVDSRRPKRSAETPTQPIAASTSAKTVTCVINEKFANRTSKSEQRTDYRRQSLRPIVNLAFILPWVLLYEIGMVFWPDGSLRSGLDQWVFHLVNQFGIGQVVVLPLLTLTTLLVWHHRSGDTATFSPKTIGGMLLETTGLGVLLFVAASAVLLGMAGQTVGAGPGLFDLLSDPVSRGRLVSCLGTGIYEELIFRVVIFLPLLSVFRRHTRLAAPPMILATIITSFVFATLHYDVINPAGEVFDGVSFLFRFLGSSALCVLFRYRGFAIAVGVHVVFDILMLTAV